MSATATPAAPPRAQEFSSAEPGFIKALTRRKDRLFALVWEFNHQPARYIDPSHMPELMESPVWPKVKDNRRALDQLSHSILRKFRLNEEYCFTFEEPRSRLALVDPQPLARLLLFAGAALCGPRIAKELSRARLTELKQTLGEPIYNFAVRQAPLLVGPNARTQLAPTEVVTGSLEHDVRATGQRLLELCLAAQPRGATERWRLKFPAHLEWVIAPPARPVGVGAMIAPGAPSLEAPRLGEGDPGRTGFIDGGRSSVGNTPARETASMAPDSPAAGLTAPLLLRTAPATRPPVDEKAIAAAWNLVHRLLTREVAPAWSSCFT